VTGPLTELVRFAGRLRAAGLAVDPTRLAAAAEALARLPAAGDPDPYWPLRLALCSRPADLPVFDAVYARWGEGAPATGGTDPEPEPGGAAAAGFPAAGSTAAGSTAAGSVPAGDEPTGAGPEAGGAGGREGLATRDVRELTPAELAEIEALVPLLLPAGRRRPAIRRGPGRAGRIDVGRTVRLMLQHGGEPARIRYRRRTLRPRRLLLLVDISQSMHPYRDLLLRFGHAAVTAGPASTEVVTIGTRWTRLTGQLRGRAPEAAMRAVARVETDWDGGTRLGPALQDLLRQWGGRDTVRAAVVVIGSDGLEFGDQALLPRQVARLSRLAYRLIWVNPLQARPGYRPVNPGLVESLRYADRQLTGHSLAALRELAAVIARWPR